MKIWRWFVWIIVTSASVLGALRAQAFSTDDEKNSVEVFEASRPSVVFVTNQQLARDPYSFDLITVPRGSGTGFVWNEKGYIVTNYHVVEGARKITITLQDQSNWPAEVVGLAPERDLAVLKIDGEKANLKALPVGDSGDLRVGRKVLAIGNPFGLDATLTTGVISALGREIESPNQRKITNVIQTDAAINPGNSGGPLLNSEGKLIGVNTMIFSPSGASAGIGFAIPVNTVKEVVPELITHGRIVRPVLGIEVAPDHWAAHIGIEGVPILRIEPNSPAAQAGFQGAKRNAWGQITLGDVIVAIEDRPVANDDDLLSTLEHYKPGDKVKVSAVRAGKLISREVQLVAPRQ